MPAVVTGIPLAMLTIPAISSSQRDTIMVGSKNFTEQNILGELIAQTLERETSLRVTRRR